MGWVVQFSGFLEAGQSEQSFVWGFADTDLASWAVRPLGYVEAAPWPRMSITAVAVERSNGANTRAR